ncbi:hypothetical protein Ae406Ps2_6467 [Pseudonocardia sp. Ae406_Ps2]|nr:hypothetical protein Ae406Ps2_6467 [Pseudonocardia sp. Ae406_Ps2]
MLLLISSVTVVEESASVDPSLPAVSVDGPSPAARPHCLTQSY